MDGVAAAGVEAKRQRITKFLALRNVSAQSLAVILADLLPEGCTRWDIKKVLKSRFAGIITRLELPRTDGTVFLWAVARLQDLLPHCVAECEGFRNVLAAALEETPCTYARPWHIVLYFDDITPGNPLKLENMMKHTALYVGFAELREALRLEEAWLTIGVLRVSVAKKVVGGIANAIRILLRATLLGPDNVRTAGIPIRIGVAVHVIFLQFGKLLADEAAGKCVWDVKGASGLRPCFDCKNVTLIEAGRAGGMVRHDAANYLVDISCHDASLFDPMSDADLWHAHDTLTRLRGMMGATPFKECEKAYGLNHNPNGILADTELRPLVPPSCNCRDPMHTTLSNGVMSTEIFALLEAYKASTPNFSYSALQDFFNADWMWPRCRRITCVQSRLARCFDPAHEASSRENQSFKGSASETLSAYPLIRYWVEVHVVPSGKIPAERSSFFSLCTVVDLMQEAKSIDSDCQRVAQQLDAEVPESLRLHKEAYGKKYIKPKRHYLGHVAKRLDFWLDCFVHERKHKVIKAAAKDIQNTRDFESSALLVILNATHGQMDKWVLDVLNPPTAISPELSATLGAPCHVSNSMRWRVVPVGVGDVFLLGADSAVQIEACVRVGNDGADLRCVVRPLTLVERLSPTSARWRRAAGLAIFLPVSQMRVAKCWFMRAGDLVVLN